jgi:hypothetical protein
MLGPGTMTLAQSAELDRLLGADRLARPLRPLGEGTAGSRDPSPTWDAWYSLPLTQRRRLLRYMAPAGQGLSLDDVAQLIGAGSLDDALEKWARACSMARGDGWDVPDVDEWAAADAQAESDAELYGPQELAARLGISVNTLHRRRHRGALPPADMTISKVPIWTGQTVREWEEWQ